MRTKLLTKIFFIFSILFLYQCNTSEETIKKDKMILNKSDYIKSIPRGMVELSLIVNQVIESGDKFIIDSTIDKIDIYM